MVKIVEAFLQKLEWYVILYSTYSWNFTSMGCHHFVLITNLIRNSKFDGFGSWLHEFFNGDSRCSDEKEFFEK